MDAPAVAVSSDGKKIAAAWMDMRQGRTDRNVYWTVGAAGKFAPEAAVHDDTRGTQGHPSIAFAKDDVAWCAWEDDRGGRQRVYAADSKSKKNIAVSDESEGKGGYPCVAYGGGIVAVAYEAGDSVAFRILSGK